MLGEFDEFVPLLFQLLLALLVMVVLAGMLRETLLS